MEQKEGDKSVMKKEADDEVSEDARQLWEAAAAGDLDTLEDLVIANVDIDVADQDGNTALMKAASHGEADVAALLVESGADFDSQSHEGRTALIHASDNGHEGCVDLLVNAGANLASALAGL